MRYFSRERWCWTNVFRVATVHFALVLPVYRGLPIAEIHERPADLVGDDDRCCLCSALRVDPTGLELVLCSR